MATELQLAKTKFMFNEDRVDIQLFDTIIVSIARSSATNYLVTLATGGYDTVMTYQRIQNIIRVFQLGLAITRRADLHYWYVEGSVNTGYPLYTQKMDPLSTDTYSFYVPQRLSIEDMKKIYTDSL